MISLFDQESLTRQYGRRQYDRGVEQGIEQGIVRGVEKGTSQQLVISVEGIMADYHASLEDACRTAKCTVDDYNRAKNIVEKDSFAEGKL